MIQETLTQKVAQYYCFIESPQQLVEMWLKTHKQLLDIIS